MIMKALSDGMKLHSISFCVYCLSVHFFLIDFNMKN